MNTKIIKAEKSIALRCAQAGVTPQGKAWLDHTLDPFKDLATPLAGYPDTDSGASVVQHVKVSRDITVPASAGAGNWDCNIYMDSVPCVFLLASSVVTNGSVARTTQGSAYYNGGIGVRSAGAGVALDMPTQDPAVPLQLDPNYYAGSELRVIGQALEIRNTTAEINKQGTSVRYRIPAENNSHNTITMV